MSERKKLSITVQEALLMYETTQKLSTAKIPLQTGMNVYDNFLSLQRALAPSDKAKRDVLDKHGIKFVVPMKLTPEQQSLVGPEMAEIAASEISCELYTFKPADFDTKDNKFSEDLGFVSCFWSVLVRDGGKAEPEKKPATKAAAPATETTTAAE